MQGAAASRQTATSSPVFSPSRSATDEKTGSSSVNAQGAVNAASIAKAAKGADPAELKCTLTSLNSGSERNFAAGSAVALTTAKRPETRSRWASISNFIACIGSPMRMRTGWAGAAMHFPRLSIAPKSLTNPERQELRHSPAPMAPTKKILTLPNSMLGDDKANRISCPVSGQEVWGSRGVAAAPKPCHAARTVGESACNGDKPPATRMRSNVCGLGKRTEHCA